jgi:hypothetical protein
MEETDCPPFQSWLEAERGFWNQRYLLGILTMG